MIRETRLTVRTATRLETPPNVRRRRGWHGASLDRAAVAAVEAARASPPAAAAASAGLQKSPGLGCFTRVRVLERRGHEW